MSDPIHILDFWSIIIIASSVLAFVAIASWLFNEPDEKEPTDG